MIFQGNLLHSTSSLIQLWLLEVLSIRSDKVESAARVRIAAISVNTVAFRFAANELIGGLRTRHSLVRAVRVGHGARRLDFAQVDRLIGIKSTARATLNRDLASIVGRWQTAPLDDAVVWQNDASHAVLHNRTVLTFSATVSV